jgi:hypothetical protein
MQGSLIQTSLPTAMTRNQNRQLAGGTTLTFPKCKVYYDGVGVTGRQCILSISAESLVIEIHTREEVIATLPLSCVKELAVRTDDLPSPHFPRDQSLTARPPPPRFIEQYNAKDDEKYLVLRAQLAESRPPLGLRASRLESFACRPPDTLT